MVVRYYFLHAFRSDYRMIRPIGWYWQLKGSTMKNPIDAVQVCVFGTGKTYFPPCMLKALNSNRVISVATICSPLST